MRLDESRKEKDDVIELEGLRRRGREGPLKGYF